MINMVEKKDSKIKKVTKKVTPKAKQEPVEPQFFAKDLAERMGIERFDFLLIKREAKIEDGSLITMSRMQELYDKVIRR